MTPKEKAKDLVNKSMPLAHDWEADNKVVAVKIALLCVDEILEIIRYHGTDIGKHSLKHWLDVKHELSLL